MILGVGCDLCAIARVAEALERHGDRFLDRVFAPAERAAAIALPEGARAAALAKRYAAKEAAAKALGIGFAEGVWLTHVEVSNDAAGRPVLEFHGPALERLLALTPAGMRPVAHLSLSDEPPLAMAQVVIEAVPGPASEAAQSEGGSG